MSGLILGAEDILENRVPEEQGLGSRRGLASLPGTGEKWSVWWVHFER